MPRPKGVVAISPDHRPRGRCSGALMFVKNARPKGVLEKQSIPAHPSGVHFFLYVVPRTPSVAWAICHHPFQG